MASGAHGSSNPDRPGASDPQHGSSKSATPVSDSNAGAAPSKSARPSLSGQLLGQYKIIEKIGQGGMGTVFRALDTALERTVAVKVLFSNALDDPKQSERFLREARSLARLNHPNLLHVYNVGVQPPSVDGAPGEDKDATLYYFTMELLQGETLSAAIRRRRRLQPSEIIPYVGQILSALHYVHQQGITHRDIKSGNIMLAGKRAVLMDFGLAKDENFSGLTTAGSILGTPEYMSPEAAQGINAGPPTDIYSIGVVLYESLCGSVPFLGRSAMSIIRQHMDSPPPPIESTLPNIDPQLAVIVHKCLSKKPEERYPDCTALAADLMKLQPTTELGMLSEANSDLGAHRAGNSESVQQTLEALLDEHGLDGTVVAGDRRISGDFNSPTLTASLTPGANANANFSVAPTVINTQEPTREPAALAADSGEETLALEPEHAHAPWRAWLWVAAGFFGVIFFAVFMSRVDNRRHQQNQAGQPAIIRKSDGTTEEIRWISFKADDPDPSKWQHTIERREKDGSWKRDKLPHDQLLRSNDRLEFVPPADGAQRNP